MKKIQFYLFITFVSSYSFGQTSHISKNDINLPKQNYFFGKHVTTIQSIKDSVYYFESIDFKYNTDSFFYWQHPNIDEGIEGYGKGTYKIESDRLFLNFENTGLVKPTTTRYNLESQPETKKNKRVITVQAFVSNGSTSTYSNAITLLDKNNNKLHIGDTSDSLRENKDPKMPLAVERYFIDDDDFPITAKSEIYHWFKPFILTINKPENYKLDVFLENYKYASICNGEKWEFQIKDFSVQKFTIQRLSNYATYLPITYYTCSYNIAKPDQQILNITR